MKNEKLKTQKEEKNKPKKLQKGIFEPYEREMREKIGFYFNCIKLKTIV